MGGLQPVPKVTDLQDVSVNGGLVPASALGSGASITGKYLRGDGTWQTIYATSGTVTSVGLTGDGLLFSSVLVNGPITTSGTLALSNLLTQTANTIFAGPNTGAAATPTFRALVAADIPDISATYSPKAGSSSITTVGTITTGTWTGTTIAIANGGTGQTTANTAFNALAPSQASANGKFLTSNGTDTSWGTVTTATGANPTGTAGLAAVNGSAATFLRSDGAPAISQAIAPTWTGVHTFSPAARTSGSASWLTFNTPADTTLTASTESIGVLFAEATRQWATGALATQRDYVFGAVTHSAVGASTITTAATLEAASPIAGTNATLTNSYAARFIASAAGHVPLVAKGATSQTGNLQEWQDSNGTALASVDKSGKILVNTTTNTNGYSFILHTTTNSNVVIGNAALAQIAAVNDAGSTYVPFYIVGDPLSLNYQGTGYTGVGRSLTPAAYLHVQSYSGSGSPVMIVQGSSSFTQTNSLQEWRNGIGTALSLVTAAGWIQNTPGRARVTANVTNATATMASLTDLSITLVAGRKYFGKLVIFANNSTAAEGLQFDFNGSTATMTSFEAGFSSTPPGSGLVLGTLTTTALGTALTATTATTADAIYTIEFSLVCNAAGTLIPRFAEVTHTSGTATVKLGSYLFIEDSPN